MDMDMDGVVGLGAKPRLGLFGPVLGKENLRVGCLCGGMNFMKEHPEYVAEDKSMGYSSNNGDKKGGFNYELWGDAAVCSLASSLFLPKLKIQFLDEIAYEHNPTLIVFKRKRSGGVEGVRVIGGGVLITVVTLVCVYNDAINHLFQEASGPGAGLAKRQHVTCTAGLHLFRLHILVISLSSSLYPPLSTARSGLSP
ncbi:hypothetical protein D9758_013187 [Tetrapyrgos nigripes]|uniref:Uncharacterized protein n=1 Tax=Tetrapyrgos nigripes TaxID=182062 RepID=A0A8H5CU41_9AGAR|nr:hypothetical protein D9758_013187 [Tetrapyrgos nigripes]